MPSRAIIKVIQNRNFLTSTPEKSVKAVATHMQAMHVGATLVISPIDGRLIGINFATVRLVFLPSIAMRVGVNASRPDLGWLASLIEADDASFRGRAERHSRDHEPESVTAERP